MAKVRITVLKCFTNEEIFGDEIPEDLDSRISPCHIHHPGQEFVFEDLEYPEGFCSWAFNDIYRDLVHLAWEGDSPFIGKPDTMFSSCTDGKKPVIFKLERVEN